MNIRQVRGYTCIAGTPVVTGLYTVLLPFVTFALFGSSRHLVVAADSATAAIFSGSASHMAGPASEKYMALVGMGALLTAGFLLLAWVFKLGFSLISSHERCSSGFSPASGFRLASRCWVTCSESRSIRGPQLTTHRRRIIRPRGAVGAPITITITLVECPPVLAPERVLRQTDFRPRKLSCRHKAEQVCMAHHWREMDSNYWSRHRETPLGRHVVSAHGPTSSKRHRPREGEMFESGFLRR